MTSCGRRLLEAVQRLSVFRTAARSYSGRVRARPHAREPRVASRRDRAAHLDVLRAGRHPASRSWRSPTAPPPSPKTGTRPISRPRLARGGDRATSVRVRRAGEAPPGRIETSPTAQMEAVRRGRAYVGAGQSGRAPPRPTPPRRERPDHSREGHGVADLIGFNVLCPVQPPVPVVALANRPRGRRATRWRRITIKCVGKSLNLAVISLRCQTRLGGVAVPAMLNPEGRSQRSSSSMARRGGAAATTTWIGVFGWLPRRFAVCGSPTRRRTFDLRGRAGTRRDRATRRSGAPRVCAPSATAFAFGPIARARGRASRSPPSGRPSSPTTRCARLAVRDGEVAVAADASPSRRRRPWRRSVRPLAFLRVTRDVAVHRRPDVRTCPAPSTTTQVPADFEGLEHRPAAGHVREQAELDAPVVRHVGVLPGEAVNAWRITSGPPFERGLDAPRGFRADRPARRVVDVHAPLDVEPSGVHGLERDLKPPRT